jgi:RNA polymerase sigma-70 factor (ECF subfamily)
MDQNKNINQLVDHLFRHESGKMIAVLSRLLGLQNIEIAQDLVQDTLLQAMSTWGYKSIPDNPSGWLYRVAKNKAIDFLRKEKRFHEISPQYSYLLESEYTLSATVNNLFLENEIQDSQLRMMFACCHPAIPEESQIALTLKTLCGLSVNEISKAFLTTEETIAKRIYRAKEKIRAEKIDLEVPQNNELSARVDRVLKSLYLLFNEGYKSSHPDKLIREDLCEEAMRLCFILTKQSLTAFPRTKALLALMCFQASRLDARLDDKSNIILLKQQDRGKWNRSLMSKGFELMEESTEPFEVSAYHLEAAIASQHAAARSGYRMHRRAATGEACGCRRACRRVARTARTTAALVRAAGPGSALATAQVRYRRRFFGSGRMPAARQPHRRSKSTAARELLQDGRRHCIGTAEPVHRAGCGS